MPKIEVKSEYLSLKEAAAISGYSADYLGQLIRSGKLPGKQVFLNVAWVTTEEALRAYLQGTKKAAVPSGGFSSVWGRMFSTEGLSFMYRAALWGVFAVCAVFIFFLGYVLAVSIDHRIEQQYLEKLERETI